MSTIRPRPPEGDARELYKYFLGWSAQQSAKKISEGETRGRGLMAGLEEGRALPGGRPPYAIDKLYLSPDGKPLHICRLLADGRQLLLHHETGETLATYGRNERTGTPAHHKKQKHEKVAFVPGDPERVAVITAMFDLHYVHGRGSAYIAQYFNDQGIPSANGGLWAIVTVSQMLVNPVYIGWGVGRRTTVGIYHMTGRPGQGALPSLVEAKELRTRKQPLKR